tara:strand:- start:459 stop:644 length:186 start_codon:yes stop_codon:yes gene_type:complete
MIQSIEEDQVIELFKKYYAKVPDLISELGMDVYGTDARADLAKTFLLAHCINENTKAVRDY